MTAAAINIPSKCLSVKRPDRPYPGLRPFEEDEWIIFFGRERMVEAVIERLAQQKLVFIHGASGSGKSSLVRAGVLPKLARQHRRHGEEWYICTMRPSGGPLWNLAQEFARLEDRQSEIARVDDIARLFNRRGATLASVAGQIEGLAGKRLCILVDQFEELFRFEREISREEAELFIELLIGQIDTKNDEDESGLPAPAGERQSKVHIIVTMRSEFLGECTRFDGLAETINCTQYLLPHMRHEALLRAIRRPAEIFGGEVTIELAERLIADVRGREDELPLIQHGLMQLWKEAEGKEGTGEKIVLETHQLDAAGGLAELLSCHADEVMLSAAPDQRQQLGVERLFRALTDINTEGNAIRRPQAFVDLVGVVGVTAEELRAIIDAFRADGVSFLTPYAPDPIEEHSVIDISHEALNRCWRKIADPDPEKRWLKREFDDGLIWRSLVIDAVEFKKTKGKHLLIPAMTDVREPWFAERTERWSDRYGGNWPLVRELVEASAKKRDYQRLLRKLVLRASVVVTVAAGLLTAYAQFQKEQAQNAKRRAQFANQQLTFQLQGIDEAMFAGRDAASFPQADENYFHDMDNGAKLTPDEIKGRNMWLVWSGGNDRFWDTITKSSLGTLELLKVVTSHPSQNYCDGPCNRDTRWAWLGAVNEPCFDKPTGPDLDRFGLWLDVRRKDCPPDPFENEQKYPGVIIGARGLPIGGGKTLPVGSYYGYASGIIGLRLFSNPDFDEAAAKRWDPERYYTDPDYYNDPRLVRPYRVGMSCGMCHVGPSPIHPPADPSAPELSNLSSTVGSQYLKMDSVFFYSANLKNFFYQVAHTYAPGTMDMSLVATDNIVNPSASNAIYNVAARLTVARRWGKETLIGGESNNPAEPGYFDPPNTVWAPRLMSDGSGSVGIFGTLNQFYVNIGVYSEGSLTHFNPFFGGAATTPFLIKNAEMNSAYWGATTASTPNIDKFFLAAGKPDHLKDAPGGEKYLKADGKTLEHGKNVFAESCARCHSSKLPDIAWNAMPDGCSGPNYLKCFMRYWDLTNTEEFKARMREIVLAPDFLEDNYLSTDARIPITLLRTNACAPLATNAIRDNIWDNFSPSTFKSLPAVGKITVQDPFTGEHWQYAMPGGGRGYTRVPSLISVWAHAPFLINKRVGAFDLNPSVDNRMNVFNDAIEQLLWPEKRMHEGNFDGQILRTTERERSRVSIPKRQIPSVLAGELNLPEPYASLLEPQISRLFDKNGNLEIGPIPKGFPIYLVNYQPLADITDVSKRLEHNKNFLELLATFQQNLPAPSIDASDEESLAWLAKLRKPLLSLSKCPDFVVNKGHYFGTAKFNETEGLSDDEKSFKVPEPVLSDDDKRALIEFLKTF